MGWQDNLDEVERTAQAAWERQRTTTTPVRRGSYREHSRGFPEYVRNAGRIDFWLGYVIGGISMLALVLILEGLGA